MLNKQKSKSQGRVIVLSGPSGAGKTTLHDLILKDSFFQNRLIRSISATTRQPRGQEKNGQDYLFYSPKMFAHRVKQKHFLEWAKVFDHYYGTPMKKVREHLKQGKHVLLCIDVQGGMAVKKIMPEAFLVFIKTPTLSALKKRLEQRKTDSVSSIRLRLQTARKELLLAKQYDVIIKNDVLQESYQELKQILQKNLFGA